MLLICATIRRYMNGSCFREPYAHQPDQTFQGCLPSDSRLRRAWALRRAGPSETDVSGHISLSPRETAAPRRWFVGATKRIRRAIWTGSTSAPPSLAPVLFRLAPHRRRRRILELEPVARAAGAVNRAEPTNTNHVNFL